jgi:hypothetical protein
MSPTTDENIDFFFEAPSTSPATHARVDQFSVLYLLRRELLETQGYDPNNDAEAAAWTSGARNRLFASLSLMFTGIDLVAKFEQGDASGGVGARFQNFLRSPDGGELDASTAELLYAVRNSLLHAFGVPDGDMLTKLGMKQIAIAQRRMEATSIGVGSVSVRTNGEVAEVYIDGVYRVLLDAVDNYRGSLYGSHSQPARDQFDQMFTKYGTIRMLTSAS